MRQAPAPHIEDEGPLLHIDSLVEDQSLF